MVDATAYADLHAFALGFPEATADHPWGHPAMKVKGKVYVFMSAAETEDGSLSVSVKLPHSSGPALLFDFASPTGYGLGKSGWVTARFAADDEVPVELLKQWIDESYRAVAPKTLAAQLPAKGWRSTPPRRPRPCAEDPSRGSPGLVRAPAPLPAPLGWAMHGSSAQGRG